MTVYERKCDICGCHIIIDETNVTVTKTPAYPVSNITCKLCKEFIKEHTGGE